jgi:hypothetical protein
MEKGTKYNMFWRTPYRLVSVGKGTNNRANLSERKKMKKGKNITCFGERLIE